MRDLDKLLQIEEKCRVFYNQFVSQEKIDQWEQSFKAMKAILKRRKLENMKNCPDLNPKMIKRLS